MRHHISQKQAFHIISYICKHENDLERNKNYCLYYKGNGICTCQYKIHSTNICSGSTWCNFYIPKQRELLFISLSFLSKKEFFNILQKIDALDISLIFGDRSWEDIYKIVQTFKVDKIFPGCTIKIFDKLENQFSTYTISQYDNSNLTKNVIHKDSALAKALIGKTLHDVVELINVHGKLVSYYTIEEIEYPYKQPEYYL